MNKQRFLFSYSPAAVAAAVLSGLTLLTIAGCGSLESTTVKQTITAVPPEMQADANSNRPAISGDGHFVAFRSDATNLVIGATNGAHHIYVKNLETGATVRASTDSRGAEGNKDSDNASISADGRYIVFESVASNLVAGDTNTNCVSANGTSTSCPDIFIKDATSDETRRLSTSAAGVQADRESQNPAISGDGRFVAFKSAATNLVPGDGNGRSDIFVKNIQSGAISVASNGAAGEPADGDAGLPAISADGRFVAFVSVAGNLVADDTNGKPDVFLKDMQTGGLTRVSVDAGGVQGNEASGVGSLTVAANGRFVAFDSGASNLVPGDENGKRDIFVKDTLTGAITLASADATGAPGSEDSYKCVSLSADGRYAAFSSDAANLVPGDTNDTSGKSDVFLKDTQTGAVTRVSTGTAGAEAKGKSEFAAISADGRLVAFDSEAANLIADDTNRKLDIFLKDTKTGATTRVSTSTSNTIPELPPVEGAD